ncbi:MAG: hypothetical protein ABT08_09935 [Microbacterium sp. SCN 71-21]|nr:MAG: hypothetical protein ABT08_09935 [Microbacterium sp. SCN 71-21]
MTNTTEVPLTRPMTSLVALGMMERAACGRMMRLSRRHAGMPRAAAASCCPWSTLRSPPRMISAE